jgi:hypothetical protein
MLGSDRLKHSSAGTIALRIAGDIGKNSANGRAGADEADQR